MNVFLALAPALAIVVLYGGLVARDFHREFVMDRATKPFDLLSIGLSKASPGVVIGLALAKPNGERKQDRYEGGHLAFVRDGRPEIVDPAVVWEMMESGDIIWYGIKQPYGRAHFLRFVRSNADCRPDLKECVDDWNERQLLLFMRALPFALIAIALGAWWAHSL